MFAFLFYSFFLFCFLSFMNSQCSSASGFCLWYHWFSDAEVHQDSFELSEAHIHLDYTRSHRRSGNGETEASYECLAHISFSFLLFRDETGSRILNYYFVLSQEKDSSRWLHCNPMFVFILSGPNASRIVWVGLGILLSW